MSDDHNDYQNIPEAALNGGEWITAKENFTWFEPDDTPEATLFGKGPFNLKEILLHVPTNDIIFVFDDKNGEERRMTSEHFKKA